MGTILIHVRYRSIEMPPSFKRRRDGPGRLASAALLLAFVVAQPGTVCLAVCAMQGHMAASDHHGPTAEACHAVGAISAPTSAWRVPLSPGLCTPPTRFTTVARDLGHFDLAPVLAAVVALPEHDPPPPRA